MAEILRLASVYLGYIVGIGAALITIYKWLVEPIKAIQVELKEQTKKLKALDEDQADILCSQLMQERDRYMTKGYCSQSDKVRVGVIYKNYRAKGRNHIAEHFMDDILSLPDKKEE